MSNAPAEEIQGEEEVVIDLAEANHIIDKYLTLPGNLMPVLQGIQDIYGYVPQPTIDLVAERLNVYPSQIYGVLTFYAQFHLKPTTCPTASSCARGSTGAATCAPTGPISPSPSTTSSSR